MSAGSALLSRDVVEKIVWDILHSRYYVYWSPDPRKGSLKKKIAPKKSLAIVVMDPTKPFPTVEFEKAILCETGLWVDNDFTAREIAFKKAEQSWRTEKDTLVIQTQLPHLWVKGDVKHAGGIFRDGIALGVSGLHWQEDQALAEEIVAKIKEYCITKSREIQKQDINFV